MSFGLTSWRGLFSNLTDNFLTGAKAMATTDQAVIAKMANADIVPFTMRPKLHGREFYRAIGEPKYIVAPMVDRSEFAWRLLTRSYMTPETSKHLLAYTPMLHARLFKDTPRFRNEHFQPSKSSLETTDPPTSSTIPFLDGNPTLDRPLFVQFCANKPQELLAAAQYVAPYCDAVDLNLGCPQGIARSGHYGAFLQEDWNTIHSLINTLHKELDVPVTAKMRILETKEKTLDYAKMILSAGASILTVHGRRREQKGHNTGLADWEMIRFLRDNLPEETVLFANGNILNGGDLDDCLEATGADGVMSAEGNLSDPTIFAKPPADVTSREYWRSPMEAGVEGYRLDGVFRRYLDIIYKYVLEKQPPKRNPLWILGDGENNLESGHGKESDADQPPLKKRKKDMTAIASPNIRAIQGHLFSLLKPMLSIHTDIRDKLARTRAGDFEGFENVLTMVEEAVKKGIQDYTSQQAQQPDVVATKVSDVEKTSTEELTFTQKTAAKYKRPWWVAQPYIRPLPEEAIALGAITVKKKEKEKAILAASSSMASSTPDQYKESKPLSERDPVEPGVKAELPQPAVVCG